MRTFQSSLLSRIGGLTEIGHSPCALCRIGLKIAIADVDEQGLNGTAKEVAQIIGEENLITLPTDVSQLDQVERLRDRVYEAWGEVS